jgi:sphinganine-1-phosphate aldolase
MNYSKILVLYYKKINLYFNQNSPLNKILNKYTFFLHLYIFYRFLNNYNKKYLLQLFFSNISKLPYINNEINNRINKIGIDIKKDLNLHTKDIELNIKLQDSKNPENIKKQLLLLSNSSQKNSKISGAIYRNNPELDKFIISIFPMFHGSNALHPNIFPGIKRMEAELVSIVLKLFQGNENCCGNITSGGTESILMTCKAHREWGYKKGILKPEIIICNSTHVAFNKAAKYFNLNIVNINLDKNGRMDINKLKHAITKNTILIVASAPSYTHGIEDDIEAISNIAYNSNIGCHVDCCLGGFILPFIKTDFKYNFTLKGITSISSDFHKYGLSPKGISIIMYNSKYLMRNQYYINTNWTGGVYATATMTGSRPGNIIALTWATLQFVGLNGYTKYANDIISTKNYILKELIKIPEIYIFGNPKVCVIGIGSRKFDICLLNDEMKIKGWNLNVMQYPVSIHLCITHYHTKDAIKTEFICDIKDSINKIINSEVINSESSSIYGTSQKISDRSIVYQVSEKYLDALYEL